MAKVLYTAIVDEVKGRLSGSVFQRSVGGNILRSLVVPVNRRTTVQQRVRSSLAAVTSAWRNCSEANRNSWDGATVRAKFEAYTSFNWLYMWLTSTRSCVQTSPSSLPVPDSGSWYVVENFGGVNVFGNAGADDGEFGNEFQWFIRISKGRQFESMPPGEMFMFRGTVPFVIQDNQGFYPFLSSLTGFSWNIVAGLYYDFEFVRLTPTGYGSTGIMTIQAV